MKDRILPIGLKGNEINERMKELMGIAPINEDKKTSAVELTKIGPDGNVYAIVRENHEYYIKTTTKKTNLVTEDFSYIGGLMNKKSEAYPTYAKAIKQLNLKFNSLNEAYGKSGQVNVFKNDNLLSEGLYEQGENTITVKRMSGGPSGVDITGIPSIDEKTYPFTMLVIKNVDGKNMARIALDDKNRFRSVDDTGFNVTTFEPTENSKQWFETLEKGEKMIAEYDKPAMRSFKKQYGDEEGKSIYYATANKQDRDPETFEKNEGLDQNDDDLSSMDRMYDTDDWVRAQRDAMGYDDTDDEDVLRGGDSRYDGYESGIGLNPDIDEAELSPKQKAIARLAGNPDEFDADDLAALRVKKKGKLSIDTAISEMDSIIEGVLDSIKKKV
jgi:hypothetical protein